MTITAQVEIDKSKIKDFASLIAIGFSLAMKFGRELVRIVLEDRDKELCALRDMKRSCYTRRMMVYI